jgi:hypothetical protein
LQSYLKANGRGATNIKEVQSAVKWLHLGGKWLSGRQRPKLRKQQVIAAMFTIWKLTLVRNPMQE